MFELCKINAFIWLLCYYYFLFAELGEEMGSYGLQFGS